MQVSHTSRHGLITIGGHETFTATGILEDGNAVRLVAPDDVVVWSLSSAAGELHATSSGGTVDVVGRAPGRLRVTARVGDVSGHVDVSVSEPLDPSGWSY